MSSGAEKTQYVAETRQSVLQVGLPAIRSRSENLIAPNADKLTPEAAKAALEPLGKEQDDTTA